MSEDKELKQAAIAVCDKAIERLKGGFVKGRFWGYKNPSQPTPYAYCAVGAVRGAPEEQVRPESPYEGGLALDAQWLVERALASQIKLQYPQYNNTIETGANVYAFNDSEDTSVYDVLAVFNTIREDLAKEVSDVR